MYTGRRRMGWESPKPYVRTAYSTAIGRTGYEIGSSGYDPGNKTIGSANTRKRQFAVPTPVHTHVMVVFMEVGPFR